ncbi:TonB-dependent receptor [Pseudoalteromonas fenneropenaei]|uniref:TonB-dependent receptor n=1 Tax=Pseudoalteromonas fenneropenaei TaxID=1737459 RepID=A0ABV7CJA5_9GAMM
MNNKYLIQSLLSASILAALSNNVFAATAEPKAEDEVEVIQVTGSRIARKEESAAPVQVISQDDLQIRGALNLGEILQEMPSVGASLNGNGSSGTSHGSNTINLRSLGENRSLILVNGNRWVNGAGTRGFRDFVDLNTIPSSIVQSVEVLQDGATAIYGADAIAGVVNIQTYRDFVGSKITAYYGQSSENDRESLNFDILHGVDIGDSNLMLALSYADQKAIYSQDRELTRIPLNGLSAGTPEGIFKEKNLSKLPFYGSSGITRDAGSDGSNPANWRAANSNDVFNRWDNNYVTGPLERSSLYLQWTQPFSDFTMRLEALYNNRKSDQLFSSAPAIVRGSRGFTIANDSRVNPFGVEFSGSDFTLTNFFSDIGQRRNKQDVDTMRLGLGFEGDIGSDWQWDAFISHARNKAIFVSDNQLDLDRLALGLLACDSSNISADISDLSSGCVPVNLFNPLTSDMADYIRFSGKDSNESRQTHARVNFSGPIAQFNGEDILIATGAEYRKEQGIDNPDSYINAAPRVNSYQTTSSAPRDGTNGEYDLYEAYAEVSIPLLHDQAYAKRLELNLASRFSDYSTFGSTVNSKIGLMYRIDDNLMLRTNWAEGFRAPSILELYEGQRASFAPVADPCAGSSGLPGCSGVPAGYVQTDTQEPITVGGNPELQPETSENTNFGIVLTPAALDNFSLSWDYYQINLDDTISTYGAQNVVNLCATTGRNCDAVSRDSSGRLTNIIDGPINLNQTKVRGWDLVTRKGFSTDFGRFDLQLNVSRLLEFTQISTLSDGSLQSEALLGIARSREAYPKYRSNLQLNWQNGDWTANYNWRHIGDTEETVDGEAHHIASLFYHNAAVSYALSEGLKLKFGINNIGDKQPPVSFTNLNINFDINTYNAIGRYYYTQVSYAF